MTRVHAVTASTRRRQFAERVLDIVIATLCLVLTLPACALSTLAVRLTSKGPAIYRQVRVGRYGSFFRCYKLRTMVIDVDARLAALLAARPDLREEFAATYKLRHDPRTTRLGRFLRRTSMDAAAAVVQCPARRDEPRRPAPAGAFRDIPLRRCAPSGAVRPARTDRRVASHGQETMCPTANVWPWMPSTRWSIALWRT